MHTPWGPLPKLDARDRDLAFEILKSDKHQLLEGLVVENTFDQLVKPLQESEPPRLRPLDVETVVAEGRGISDRPWIAFVWARQKSTGLRRYLDALSGIAHVCLVEHTGGKFVVARWAEGRRAQAPEPLHDYLVRLTGRTLHLPTIDPSVRDVSRQQTAFWGYLNTAYPDTRLWNEVVLTRLLINFGIQPFFPGLWNLDRIYLFDDRLWMLEVKHKFPFERECLYFGLNTGELKMMRLVADAGIRTLHALIVKPIWSREEGSMYMLSRMDMRERAVVAGIEMKRERVRRLLAQPSASSPKHTSYTGQKKLDYKSIPARDFLLLGVLSDGPKRLAASLEAILVGRALPSVTDDLLRHQSVQM